MLKVHSNSRKFSILSCSVLAISLLFSGTAYAKQSAKPTVNYAAPQGTLINGEEATDSSISPKIIGYSSPIFVSYTANNNSTVPYFKYIAGTSWDNTRSSSPFPISINITQSSSSGSEFNGNLQFDGSVKDGIIGKLNVQLSMGAKETRQTNEAVGWSFGPLNIPAYKSGGIDAYWEGTSSYGTVGVKYPDTGSLTGYTPIMYYNINVRVHESAYKKINGKTWIS